MNVFQAVLRPKRKVDRDYLPDVYSFVDIATGGKTEWLPVEEIDKATFDVRRPSKAAVGAKSLFNYHNNQGRFRFQAECVAVADQVATYSMPAEIIVIEKFGHKRRSYRLKYALAVDWRYAPDGVGYGDFHTSATADVSCAGVSLVVPRDLKVGTQIEVKLELNGSKPIMLVGTTTRPTQRQPSGKFLAGLAFTNVSPTSANEISQFIAKRQNGQRKRYLANEV